MDSSASGLNPAADQEGRMTGPEFHSLVVTLWGERWRRPFHALLRRHGHKYARSTVWNWQASKSPVPEPVTVILNEEAKRKGVSQLSESTTK
jgi:hypothetical protein